MSSQAPALRLRRDRQTGTVEVRIVTPRGTQWLSTGQTTLKAARAIVDAAMLDRLQLAASANALTADVISRMLTGRRFTCGDILAAWKAECVESLAPESLKNYEASLRQAFTELRCEREPLASLKRVALSAWVNAAHVPLGTRKLRLSALRSFYKFAAASGFCVGNPAALVALRTRDLLFSETESKETLPLTPEEYAHLAASPSLSPFWRAALGLGYWLSLSIRDAACVEWDSFRGDRFIYFRKKTGKRISLPLDDPLLGAGEMQRIFLAMLERSTGDSPFCFPEKRAVALDPVKRAKLSVQFQRLLVTHGIKGKRFHSCRHAAAMRFVNAGKTLEEIGQVLGHSSEITTKIYTSHVTRDSGLTSPHSTPPAPSAPAER